MTATAQGHRLWGCLRCGGLWLDPAASVRLTTALVPDALALADLASRRATVHVELSGTQLPCPECMRPLIRRRLPVANVDLDHCDEHGVWFDKGELVVVARALAVSAAALRAGPQQLTPAPLLSADDALDVGADVVAAVADGDGVDEDAELTREVLDVGLSVMRRLYDE